MLSKTIKKTKLLPFIGMFCLFRVDAQEMKPSCHICPPISNCFTTGFFVEADFLYWRPEVNELDYALSLNQFTLEAIDQYSVRYDWNPGFQVAIGYLFQNNWDLLARYTNYRASGTDMISSLNPDLFSSFVHLIDAGISSATSHTKLYYDILDIEAIRHILSKNRLELLAFLGVRGAWVTQNWKTDYSPIPGQTGVQYVQNKWIVRGGGLRFGFDGNLQLGCGFSIFGTGALTGLLADQDTKFRTIALSPGLGNIFQTNIRFNRTKVFPILETAIGLGWGSYFRKGILKHRKDLWGLHIGARYEFIQWWNINDIERLDDSAGFDDMTPGDLGLHGLTLRVTVVF